MKSVTNQISAVPPLLEQIQAGGPVGNRAAGRLMSLMENQPQLLGDLLQQLGMGGLGDTMPRLLVGVTGAPGSGKSTLVDSLVAHCRAKHPDRRVGVIAVDPSSPFTGGALLGDRVRMMSHSTDPMVYVRSLASRGHLGGLSLGVKGVIRVMGLIGCDTVLIETVGVGQSEVEIAQVADTVVVVLAPGQGDTIQLLKAGLLEIADLFAVNKADRDDAQLLYQQLLAAMQLDQEDHQGDPADRVSLVSAASGQGVSDLLARIEQRIDPARQATRRAQSIQREILQSILQAARQRLACAPDLSQHVADVTAGTRTVEQAVVRLLEQAARQEPQT